MGTGIPQNFDLLLVTLFVPFNLPMVLVIKNSTTEFLFKNEFTYLESLSLISFRNVDEIRVVLDLAFRV